MRARRRRSRILLAGSLLGGLVLGAELVLTALGVTGRRIDGQGEHQRAWLRAHTLRVDPAPGAFYGNVPARELELDGVAYAHDERGARVTAVDVRADAVSLPFLGDSTTYGLGVAGDQTLPAHVARRLGGRVRPLNLGVVGYGPSQELARYRAVRDALGDAPLIVLVMFPNDSMPTAARWDAEHDVLYYDPLPLAEPWRPVLWRSALYRGLAALVTRRQYADGTLDPLTPANVEGALATIGELADEVAADGRRLLVACLPQMVTLDPYLYEDQRRAVLAGLAARGVACVDLLPAFLEYRDQVQARRRESGGAPPDPGSARRFLHTFWVSPDDPHPDGLAYGIAARALAERVADELGLD